MTIGDGTYCGQLRQRITGNEMCVREPGHDGACDFVEHSCPDCGTRHGACCECGATHGDSHGATCVHVRPR